jgi:hypothetical protein
MKTFKSYLKEGLEDVKKANREKEAALKQTNRDKENLVRRAERDKEALKRKSERDKERAKSKKESIIQKVTEYIKSDGARRKCAGGDGRRTENHNCDKVHSGMTHKEWEASQDTPKDEAKSGDKEAYNKFFDAKLKKYGVKSPDELSGEDKKKFYDEIDAEWEGDNEED